MIPKVSNYNFFSVVFKNIDSVSLLSFLRIFFLSFFLSFIYSFFLSLFSE